MEPREGWLERRGGPRLWSRWWAAPGAVGCAVVVHGFGDHGGRYAHVADALAGVGLSVIAADLRGLGRSEGRRGHVGRFEEYVEDAALALATARERAPGPALVLGHSVGGLLAALLASGRGGDVDLLVLSAPAVRLTAGPSAPLRAVARVASRVWPTFRRPSGVDPRGLSHDPEVVRALERDPFAEKTATARLFTELARGARRALGAAPGIRAPLLALHGGADPIADPEGTRELVRRAGSEERELRVLPGLLHEVLHEVGREEVLVGIAEWARERLPGRGG